MAIVITAAGIYTVIPGETYIIAPSVSGTVKFQAVPGTVAPVDFAVSFTESGASGRIEMHDGNGPLSPAVSIADDVDIGHMQIDLLETVNADLTAGDNVTTGKIFGSHDGVDDFSFGDGATIGGIETEGGADAIVLGTARISAVRPSIWAVLQARPISSPTRWSPATTCTQRRSRATKTMTRSRWARRPMSR